MPMSPVPKQWDDRRGRLARFNQQVDHRLEVRQRESRASEEREGVVGEGGVGHGGAVEFAEEEVAQVGGGEPSAAHGVLLQSEFLRN